MVVNRRELATYFHTDALKRTAREPLAFLEMHDKFDVLVNVNGGGENRPGGCHPPRAGAGAGRVSTPASSRA